MILTDVLRAAAVAAIPLLAALGQLTVYWVYGLAFISSTLTIFFNSSEFAAIPSLVNPDDLIRRMGASRRAIRAHRCWDRSWPA